MQLQVILYIIVHMIKWSECDNNIKYQGVKEFHLLARIGCNCKVRQSPKTTKHL